jgi:acyl carrier protein
MISQSTSQLLVRYISLQIGHPVDEHTDLLDSALLDSLMLTDLVLFIQTEFGVVMGPEDITRDNFGNAAAVSDLILRKRNASRVRAA